MDTLPLTFLTHQHIIYIAGLTNIAKGKQTQQSSTETVGGHLSPSSLAVDGLVNNRYSAHDGFKCAHTMKNGEMPYWRVDFGAEAEIYQVSKTKKFEKYGCPNECTDLI